MCRILLIEDNEISRLLMSDYLEYCGWKVFSLAEGETFLETMQQFQPHLVLLDLKLPGVDGFTLLAQAQQTPDWFRVPIVVVSAFAFQSDQQRALNLGARRYLVKPVKPLRLKEVIAEELNLSRG